MNFYCWGNAPTDPATTWQNVGFGYGKLHEVADPLGKKVVVHESWYPTSGDTRSHLLSVMLASAGLGAQREIGKR